MAAYFRESWDDDDDAVDKIWNAISIEIWIQIENVIPENEIENWMRIVLFVPAQAILWTEIELDVVDCCYP